MIQKKREEGLSLRSTFVFMLIVSIVITVILLATTFSTIRSFHALSDATDAYISMQDAATSLMSASDYLTEEAQCYTVMGDRQHLDNYLYEAEQEKRRERAVAAMEQSMPDSVALNELKDAMANSVSLMDREYYAMALMASAQGHDMPAALSSVEFTPEDEHLSVEAKKDLAERMMHDEAYYSQKNEIRDHLSRCVNELKGGTHGTQQATEAELHQDLVWITVMIILQSLGVVLILALTTKLGINPVLRAVEHIKRDQSLPITGAHEFRYLAGTYNKMYSAYKRSVENLSFQASHDELTGVYNRAGYDLLVKSVDLGLTAFLLFDADQFKQVNDTYGHDVGDKVLQKMANTLKQNFRSDDYVCRIGGDEFVVFMVHVDDSVETLLRQKFVQINASLANTDDGLPPLSVSVGVVLGHEGENAQQVFHKADVALYYVKNHGKGDICFYTPGLKSE